MTPKQKKEIILDVTVIIILAVLTVVVMVWSLNELQISAEAMRCER